MFGYIECNRSKLSSEELERYQGVYCGLCRNLKSRYGELERLRDFEQALHEHIHIENNIIFPRSVELEARCVAW